MAPIMNGFRHYWNTHRGFRDAWFLSLALGSVGWLTGATITGGFNGADPWGGLVLFTAFFGTLGWIIGYVIGITVEQSITYYQGPEPSDAAPEPNA